MKKKRNWHKFFIRITWVISILFGLLYMLNGIILHFAYDDDVVIMAILVPVVMGGVWLIYAICYGFYKIICWIISALDEDD